MDKKTLKTYLLLISFTIGLVLIAVHFEKIISGISIFLQLLTPFFIGIIIAFVLNRPYEWFCQLYGKRWGLNSRISRILAIITVYILAFGAIILLICLVVPELIRNLSLFAGSADQYLLDAQAALNGFTEQLNLPPVDLSALIDTVSRYLGTLSNAIEEMIPQIIEVTGSLISGVITGFISIVLSVYLLSGKDQLLKQLRRALKVYLPKRTHSFLADSTRLLPRSLVTTWPDNAKKLSF